MAGPFFVSYRLRRTLGVSTAEMAGGPPDVRVPMIHPEPPMKTIAALCLLLLMPGCSVDSRRAKGRGETQARITDKARQARRIQWRQAAAAFTGLPDVLDRCRSASRTEIFGGLPHPETPEYAAESRRSDTFANHGFRFYSPRLNISQRTRKPFLSKISMPESYEPWSGMKFCGHFHPDLLIRFHDAAGVVDLHLCLGCYEARFFDGAITIHVDLNHEFREPLKVLEEKHRHTRPPGSSPWRVRSANAIDDLIHPPTEPPARK